MTSGITPVPTPARARRAWIMLIVLTMLSASGMTVVIPVLPFVVLRYSDQPHLALWVGVLETVNALCAFIVAPILGRLSDRFGRRPVIIIAAFGAVLGFALFGIGGSIWVLLIGRIIQGLTAGDMPALFAYLADITPAEQRAKRFGLLGALTGIATMVAPALGGLLAAVNVDLPVFVTAGLALVSAVLAIFVLPESLAPANRSAKIDVKALHPFAVFRDAFVRKELRGLLIGFALSLIPFFMFINNFSVLALDSIQWNATQVGLVVAAVGIVDIAIQGALLPLLLPRIGERGVIIAGIVVQALGLGALALVGSLFAEPWLFVVGSLVMAAGQGASQASMDGVMSNSVGDDEQGWIAGVGQSLSSGVGMIAPLLAGALYATVGHSAPYWLGLLLMVAAAIVLGRARFASPSKRTAAVEATPEPA